MRYPLRLTLRPSVRIQTLMFAMHGIAASALLFSALPLVLSAAMVAAVLVSLWLVLRRQAAGSLLLGDDGWFELGEDGRLRVLASTTDFGWAIWLHWVSDEGRRGALMLAPDSLPAGGWRRLRIWLRHKAGASSGHGM
ncbi:hypothetical protein IAI53_07835 [Thauera sp. CAU 1555]|uniref:Toxin CptA n=1 Tax=Thauera sedimentorum TaxID=2767595 RepID=A0ABR9BBH6_9RHOO|nr:protein YgfX [Thauera sedimentorum]MBC9071873.1 hypothetical protein [Thauera sedimentorum]MBD8502792.1 hypothetical protein [Thauera sedimentorum]